MAVIHTGNIYAPVYGLLAAAHDGAGPVVVLFALTSSFDRCAVGILIVQVSVLNAP